MFERQVWMPFALVVAATGISVVLLFSKNPPHLTTLSVSLIFNFLFIGITAWALFRPGTSHPKMFVSVAMIQSFIICLILQFAVAYKVIGLKIDGNFDAHPDSLECLYFSVMTWTTVGYGDVVPTGNARFFASIEAFTAYLAMAFLIAGITKLWDSKH